MSQGFGSLPVCPRSLLSPDRLDIAIKWRFFCHLIAGGDPDAERVYRWHIAQRTNGIEKGSWKRSVDDYVAAARELLTSMQANGFDPSCPIPIGTNGRMRNGAHRLACALALGIDVAIERIDKPGTASPWGERWLLVGGIGAADLRRAKSDWESLHGQIGDRPGSHGANGMGG
jgi:hypothetical protein